MLNFNSRTFAKPQTLGGGEDLYLGDLLFTLCKTIHYKTGAQASLAFASNYNEKTERPWGGCRVAKEKN
jgi:hypothetical protein